MSQSRVPPAFVIAAAMMLIVGISIELIATYGATHMTDFRDASWTTQFLLVGRGMVSTGYSFAVTALMVVGLLELARRSGPGLEGAVLRVAAAMAGVLLVLALARTYVSYWWWPQGGSSPERVADMERFWRWHARVMCFAACASSAALVVAGRRLAVVLWTALPLLVLTALQHPTMGLYELVNFDRPENDTAMWTQAGIDIWVRIGFVGALMATVTAIAASLPPAPADMVRAGQGLERVGSGLVARVIVILVAAFSLIMTVGAQSPAMARVAGVIFPTCLLVASIAIVTGMLQAGGLAAAGAPRLRLYTGAALSIAAMAIDAVKAISLYLALRRGSDLGHGYIEERLERTAAALSYFTPALALAGLLCTLSAAARLRRMVPEARVDEAGINAAAASVVIFTASAVALLRWGASDVKSPGVFVMISILVAIANIIAQLAVARVCHRVGAAMREVSALPTAVATVK